MPRVRGLLPLAIVGAVLAAALARLLPARGPAGEGLPPAAHEMQDVAFRPMLVAGGGMLAALAAVLGLAFWLYPMARQDQAIQQPLPSFPTPQLQTDPAADMAAFRTRQRRQLETAYWIDHAASRVHLPIAQAMQDIAGRGIPDWPVR